MFGRDLLLRAQYRLRQVGRERKGSPRILVIGVCQGGAVARVMRYLLPEARIDFVSAFTAARRHRRLADLIGTTDRYDKVFTNVYLPPFRDDGTITDLAARPNVRIIPTLMFPAYHPDLVHVGKLDAATLGGLVSGPMGHSHSAVTLYAYLAGFSEAQALRLFTEAVFERLGYFEFWTGSVAAQRQLGRDAGFDLDAALTRWPRRGCFMHSINHPKLYVVADIARGLLAQSGIAFEECDLDAFMPDDLGSMGSWPVYPEIAQHYGVQGSALFFKAETPRSGPARTMTRAAFVKAAYAYYANRPREALVNARVGGWQADEATVDFFRSAAGHGASASPSARSTVPVPGRSPGMPPRASIQTKAPAEV